MQIQHVVVIFVALIMYSSISPAQTSDIVSRDGFESCPADENWIEVDYENGWSSFNASLFGLPAYRKDHHGVVHLQGLVGFGICEDVGESVIITLPPGYRPLNVVVSLVSGASGPARVDVAQNGEVVIQTNCDNSWISLWDISLRTF